MPGIPKGRLVPVLGGGALALALLVGGGLLALDLLRRHPAGLREGAVAVHVAGGHRRLGLGAGDPGGLLGDHGLLEGGAVVDAADGGLQAVGVRGRLVQAGLEGGGVQAHQHLAWNNALVVGHQHLGDIAGDLRADLDGVGLDEGVVGGLVALLVDEPQPAADDQRHGGHAADDQGNKLLLRRGGHGLRIPKTTQWTGAIYRTFVPGKG
jgi:hypothetical protein